MIKGVNSAPVLQYSSPMTHNIIIDRLLEACWLKDPWGVDWDWTYALEATDRVEIPADRSLPAYATPEYHGARVAFLMDNVDPTPIYVDSLCSGGYIQNVPVIDDGWHRTYAALLRGERTIPAIFGGNNELLEWLTGVTDQSPEF